MESKEIKNKKRLLIVDDEKIMFDTYKDLLFDRMDRWELIFTSDPDEAERIGSTETVDVVVLDIRMPGRSGLDLLQSWCAGKEPPPFEIVMITGMDDARLKRLSIELGATDLLHKPLKREDLVARLESSIRIKTYKDSLIERGIQLARINDMLSTEIELRKQAEVRLRKAVTELENKNEVLNEIASQDQLTGISNRRRFFERLSEYTHLSERFGQTLCCIMGDIDHFKEVNDRYGHNAGDYVLKHIARILEDNLRKTDILARYGGEEFVILLPDTEMKFALEIAEELRLAVGKEKFEFDKDQIELTISFGISAGNKDSYLGEALVERADRALYHAKENGRNRVSRITDKDELL